MKNFIKGRWFPLAVAVSAVLVIALFLFFCGFRITYAPELESSWDAISSVAAWAGVFASVLAIIFAIRVPKKIAEEQNKIALFEKRFQCFQLLERFIKLAEYIEEVDITKDLPDTVFFIVFDFTKKEKIYSENFLAKMLEYRSTIHQMRFLFNNIDKDDIYKLYSAFHQFIGSILDEDNIPEMFNSYKESVDYFMEKYRKTIFEQLEISNM